MSAGLSDESARAERAKPILYIDSQRLTRECVAEPLAHRLPEKPVEAIASARELTKHRAEAYRFAVGIFNKHGAPISDPVVVNELSLLMEAKPDIAVVLLSDIDNAEEVAESFKFGIRGYIPTTLPILQAVEAIRLVDAGGIYWPTSVLSHTISPVNIVASAKIEEDCCTKNFTPRQLDVLKKLWQGKQNKLIAHDLSMCESTVKVHIRHIMKKLHARNRTQVVLLTRQSMERVGAEKP